MGELRSANPRGLPEPSVDVLFGADVQHAAEDFSAWFCRISHWRSHLDQRSLERIALALNQATASDLVARRNRGWPKTRPGGLDRPLCK